VRAAARGGALTAQQNGSAPDDGGPVWLFTAPAGETIAGGTIVATLQAPQSEDWISTPGDTNTSADDFAYCAFTSHTPCAGTGTFTIDHAGGTNIYAVARCVNSDCPGNIGETAAVSISTAEISLQDEAPPACSSPRATRSWRRPPAAARASTASPRRSTARPSTRGPRTRTAARACRSPADRRAAG
jgi:hypothetical protein